MNFVTAWLIGPELPDIIVGFSSLIIGIIMAKNGILILDNIWDFPERKSWSAVWLGGLTHKEVWFIRYFMYLSFYQSRSCK